MLSWGVSGAAAGEEEREIARASATAGDSSVRANLAGGSSELSPTLSDPLAMSSRRQDLVEGNSELAFSHRVETRFDLHFEAAAGCRATVRV